MKTKSKMTPQKKMLVWLAGIFVVAVVAVVAYSGATGQWVKGLLLSGTTTKTVSTIPTLKPQVTYKYLSCANLAPSYANTYEDCIYETQEPPNYRDNLIILEITNNSDQSVYLKKLAVNNTLVPDEVYYNCDNPNNPSVTTCDLRNYPAGRTGKLLLVTPQGIVRDFAVANYGTYNPYFPYPSSLDNKILPGGTMKLISLTDTRVVGNYGKEHNSGKVEVIPSLSLVTDESGNPVTFGKDSTSMNPQPIVFK